MAPVRVTSMTLRRALAGASISALLVTALTACFGIPQLPTDPGGGEQGGDSIVDTTWAGTDSDGDAWEMTFQGDNTVAIVFNDSSFDSPSDTYQLDGSTLTISVSGFQEGTAAMTGRYTGNSTPIELDGTLSDHTFTLTLDPR